ncbi:MAG: prolipoprotein diacylglyceryl transferase [Clostridia bacterium]|nr:prolipoprotein diacylglyceryl transferase [Clostridia bacterium]MBQ7727339.1 prolipoprotein diacylglyceryl transferase [Clostridia bacterium]
MHPEPLFWGIDLYSIMIGIGVISVLVLLRVGFDRLGIKAKLFNMCIILAISSVVIGYGFAVLFQAFYNYVASGTFTIRNDTGSTFYGGLIGGTITVIAGYLIAGHFMFPDGYHKKQLFNALSVGALCVACCHGFGRIGCLMAGCCYGHDTDAWYGIYMQTTHTRVVPTQLFEALFLFALAGVLFWKIWTHRQQYNLSLYMVAYGIWRFFIEYVRADYRGSLIPGITPSQLIAVVLVVLGFVLFFIERMLRKKEIIA